MIITKVKRNNKPGIRLYAKVDSSSTVGKSYLVTKRVVVKRATVWGCTCEGYTFRGKCKHIDNVKENI